MKKLIALILLATLSLSTMVTFAANEEFGYQKIIYSEDFDSMTVKNTMNHFSGFEIQDGKLELDYENKGNPLFYSNLSGLRVDLNEVSYLEFRFTTQQPIKYLQFFFVSTTDGGWDQNKLVYYTDVPVTEEMGVYRIYFKDFPKKSLKNQILSAYRFDIYHTSACTNHMSLDYIRFCSDGLSVTESSGGAKYDFTYNNPLDGWDIDDNAQNVYISEGVIGGEATNAVNVETCAELSYDAKEIINVNIKYKNQTPSTSAYLYYKTTGQTEYTEDNKIEFTVTPDDTQCSSYNIDVSDIESWRDNITGLRFVLPGGGAFAIDEISLQKYPATITKNGNIVTVNGNNPDFMFTPVYCTVEDMRNGNKLLENSDAFINAEGAFNFNFTGEDLGEAVPYKITLSFFNGDSYSKIYPFVGENFESEYLLKVNQTKASGNVDDLYALIKNNYNYVENSTSNYFDIFAYEGKYTDYFASALLDSSDFTTLDAMGERIDECIILSWLFNNDETHSDDTKSILEDYEASVDGKFFKGFDEQTKVQCLTAANAINPYSYNDFYESLTEQSILYAVSVATGYEAIMEIVETYAEELGIDRNTVDNLANKELVYLNMVGCSGDGVLTSYSQLADAFDAANNNINPPSSGSSGGRPVGGGNSSGSRPSGGGSSGGGSSGVGAFASNKPVNVSVDNATYMYPEEEVKKEQGSAFSDMAGFEWALEGVENLRLAGIINGRGNDKFEPQGLVTREEFVKMFVLATGAKGDTSLVFDDVVSGQWYEEYIKAAVSNGYITGISADKFGVGQNITRQDVCVIAARVLTSELSDKGETWEMTFSDVDSISDYAKDAVKVLNNVGLVTGADGLFRPLACLTRAEAAVIIDRMMKFSDTI